MESLLVKIFGTALALSQVTTAPDAVQTRFDRTWDQPRVAELLQAGCTHMLKAFDLEDINLDELITIALDDPQSVRESHAFRGINFVDLQKAYREFCKNERVPVSAVDLGAVIEFYNKAVTDLPDHTRLLGVKLPGASVVLDRKGERFAEVFEENERRAWIALADIPEQVRRAFIAAEDQRFYEHRGVDERGLSRAFIGNLAGSRRPQGGSTITQQVVKNLLVGEDLTYERKIREMIVASRLERTLSKDQILELYLNLVYLGRGAWGIEMAARSYFGKPAKELTPEEGALLGGIDERAQSLQSRPTSRARSGAARIRPRPHAGGRCDQSRSASADDCRICRRWLPTRSRAAISAFISSTRSCARPGRPRESKHSHPTTTRCARRLIRSCSGRLSRHCRRGCRAMNEMPAACRSNPRRRTSPVPFAASRRGIHKPTSDQPGSRPSPMRGWRSTTCTGRRQSCSRSRPAEKARSGVWGCPMDAFSRSPPTSQLHSASSCSTTWSSFK